MGSWQLESFEIFDSTENLKSRKFRPWRYHPWGILTYTADGYVFVGINCMMSDESAERKIDPRYFVFYTGTYKVKNNGPLILHKIYNSSRFNLLGKELKRYIFLNGDVLTITGTAAIGPVRLVWKRLGASGKGWRGTKF